jgi:hypothetical protein
MLGASSPADTTGLHPADVGVPAVSCAVPHEPCSAGRERPVLPCSTGRVVAALPADADYPCCSRAPMQRPPLMEDAGVSRMWEEFRRPS